MDEAVLLKVLLSDFNLGLAPALARVHEPHPDVLDEVSGGEEARDFLEVHILSSQPSDFGVGFLERLGDVNPRDFSNLWMLGAGITRNQDIAKPYNAPGI